MLTDVRAGGLRHIQLNEGLFIKNFDYSAATDAHALHALVIAALDDKTSVLGATRGGGTFELIPNVRRVEAQDAPYPLVGAAFCDGWTVKMTGTMLEITPQNMKDVLIAADLTHKAGSSKWVLAPRSDIRHEDYIPLLCWVGDTTEGLVLICLKNALNLCGARLRFTQQGEGTMPFEFYAHQAAPFTDAPFEILFFDFPPESMNR